MAIIMDIIMDIVKYNILSNFSLDILSKINNLVKLLNL